MPLESRDYVVFLGAAAASFGFVVIVAAISLRAQDRGKELLPLLVKLAVSLGGSAAGAYWLGQRLHAELGWEGLLRLGPADIAVLALVVACIGFAIWSAAKAVSPRHPGAH
jgi:hypothetical protein